MEYVTFNEDNEFDPEWRDAQYFIDQYDLNFCGCGRPNDVLYYLWKALSLVDDLKENVWENKKTHEEWQADKAKVFSNIGEEYFMWYFLDSNNFTEHGGSVPGWLTDGGKRLLKELSTYCAMLEREGMLYKQT